MRRWARWAAAVIGAPIVCLAADGGAGPGEPVQADIPLGVYWAGEHVPAAYGNDPARKWDELDKRFKDLAAHHVNAIWLTHTDVKEGAEFARHAGKYGIRLVASLGPRALEVGGQADEAHMRQVRDLIVGQWGDAPPPFAWGLGDEPDTAVMEDVGKANAVFKEALKNTAAPTRTTAVTMPRDVTAAARMADFDYYTVDIYPFFSANNVNGPGDHAASTWYYVQACERVDRLARAKGKSWWVMPQIYQEPWGPYDLDAKGNIVHLAGGGPHWRMPTEAEVKWQTWASLACGARGVMYFIYSWPGGGNPKAPPIPDTLGFKVPAPTNTMAPRGVVYPDGRPTPQYEAMGQAFGEVRKLAPLLLSLKPAAQAHAWWTGGWPWPGDLLTCWDGPADPSAGTGPGKAFAIIVNGNCERKTTLGFALAKPWTGARDLRSGQRLKVVNDEPFVAVECALEPGEGTVVELLQGEAAAAPAEAVPPDPGRRVYTEDFADPARYQKDAKAFQNVAIFKDGHNVLSAANGGLRAAQAWVIYDVYKLVGQAPGDAYRLTYLGSGGAPHSIRGVHWWVSRDGAIWEKFSFNQFGRPVSFRGRYLRAGMMWIQASDFHYGYLQGFTVQNWLASAPDAPGAAEPTKARSVEVNFDTDAWKQRVVESKNVVAHDGVLAAANGSTGAENAYIVCDLDTALGAMGKGGRRRLTYSGAVNGPDHWRGVHWWVSDDGKTWALLSVNEFDAPVDFRGRYLKAGTMWIQAADYHYGHLKNFKVEQLQN